MDSQKALWNEKQNQLRSILLKPERFDEAIQLCLEQHAMVHVSSVSELGLQTFEDELWEGLAENAFRSLPKGKGETIAWGIWHITRIEDITMNILVDGGPQVIKNNNWLEKMDVSVCDTGNAMTHAEITAFSSTLNMQILREYRVAVGQRTREIISNFNPADLKRKMQTSRLQRIIDESAVLNIEGANWLIDFWGRKNVAGILLMPVTRHQLVHINESLRLKQLLMKK